MATPDLNKLSDEELEKLTAPDQGDSIASAVAPAVATEEAAAVGDASTGDSADPTPTTDAPEATPLDDPQTEPPVTPPAANPFVDSGANTPNPVVPQIPVVPEPAAVTPSPTTPTAINTQQGLMAPTTVAETPVAAVPAEQAAPQHQFTGKSVKVHLSIKGFDLFDHTFQVSTEPIVDIINRVAKSRFGCDITLLDELRIFVHGEQVSPTSQAHTLGLDGEANIEVTYD